MAKAKFTYNGRDFSMTKGVTTFGRTSDNFIAFPDDTNVSRYHAEVESAGEDEYWLIDLDSSNGTTLNGSSVKGKMQLNDGDEIVLGGSSRISIAIEKESKPVNAPDADLDGEETTEASSADDGTADAESDEKPGRSKKPLVLGAAAVLAIAAIGTGAYFYSSGPACNAVAQITYPEAGEAISKPTDIEIKLSDGGCVSSVVYTVNGEKASVSDKFPFSSKIDPQTYPELADGRDHRLGVVMLDEEGKVIGEPSSIELAFESSKVAPDPDKPIITQNGGDEGPIMPDSGSTVTLIDVNNMAKQLVKQFPGKYAYNVSDKQFLQEVLKRTSVYAKPGFYERAAKYRDAINVAYVQEQNLDASLGYLLAMSRSNFLVDKQGGEGLWKMDPAFVEENKYNGLCGEEKLSDPSQQCASKASAIYMKAIVNGVFEGDALYSVLAFGRSPVDAVQWKESLPKNRSNLWAAVKTPREREMLINLFAAGIVAENPQKFGLNVDKPLSELYKTTL